MYQHEAVTAAETEPELYRLFTFAVLADHRSYHYPDLGWTVCSCGKPRDGCRVTQLARRLGVIGPDG